MTTDSRVTTPTGGAWVSWFDGEGVTADFMDGPVPPADQHREPFLMFRRPLPQAKRGLPSASFGRVSKKVGKFTIDILMQRLSRIGKPCNAWDGA